MSFVTLSSEVHFDQIEKKHFAGAMGVEEEVLEGFEPDEEEWEVKAEAARLGHPGGTHSDKGVAHDRMLGGVKWQEKPKKLREKAASARC